MADSVISSGKMHASCLPHVAAEKINDSIEDASCATTLHCNRSQGLDRWKLNLQSISKSAAIDKPSSRLNSIRLRSNSLLRFFQLEITQ